MLLIDQLHAAIEAPEISEAEVSVASAREMKAFALLRSGDVNLVFV